MARNHEKANVPIFDGDEENYDRWASALLAVGMIPSADEFSYKNAR